MLMNEKPPNQVKSFQRKIAQMGPFQKLENSIETLYIILWPVYKLSILGDI